ncbi:P-loop containing nucleoside triphosphate hydrolase protein, partial [Rhypophila decipiens]
YYKQKISFHRGYLFVGPPGTGKSILVNVIATTFGLPLYVFPCNRLTPADFRRLLGCLAERCIVLFDDLDVVVGSWEVATKDHASKLSQTDLLTCFDGINSPHGVVIVATVNKAESLPPAMTREGRFDERVDFGLATKSQVEDLITPF